jgi:hypothetical protein
VHIQVYYETEEEKKLANDLRLALAYGYDMGAELENYLHSNVEIDLIACNTPECPFHEGDSRDPLTCSCDEPTV